MKIANPILAEIVEGAEAEAEALREGQTDTKVKSVSMLQSIALRAVVAELERVNNLLIHMIDPTR